MLSPPSPPSFTNNKTLVLNQGSRCLYVFIYSDIYSVFVKAVCLPGCIPEILKTYMLKPQRSKTCVLWTLCKHIGLGQSLKWFMLGEQNECSHCPRRVLWNVLDGLCRTWQDLAGRTLPVVVFPLCWVREFLGSIPTVQGLYPPGIHRLTSLSAFCCCFDTDSHDVVQSGWNSLCSLGWSITCDPLSRTLKC